MKPATTALINYLNANDTVAMADLWTFSIVGNLVLRYVDYPLPQIQIPQTNFPGSPLNYAPSGVPLTFLRGPKFGRSKVATKVGIEPSELDLNIYADTNVDFIGDLTWQSFTLVGGFDGAFVELNRFFMPTGNDGIAGPLDPSLGAIVWFYGKVATAEITRTSINIKVKSLVNLLHQQQMPRRIFQTGCTHIFGDAMCGYDRINGKNALGQSTGIGAGSFGAQAGSTQWNILDAGTISQNFAQGTCVCLTGQNVGISRGISGIVGGLVELTRPFPFPVSAGDSFNLLPGCDHTIARCQALNNLARYGGFPYIPPPELAI